MATSIPCFAGSLGAFAEHGKNIVLNIWSGQLLHLFGYVLSVWGEWVEWGGVGWGWVGGLLVKLLPTAYCYY